MQKRYFRIEYGVPGYRSAKDVIVAVPVQEGLSTADMAKVAVEKLEEALGEKVNVLRYNKMPSNYKPRSDEIE